MLLFKHNLLEVYKNNNLGKTERCGWDGTVFQTHIFLLYVAFSICLFVLLFLNTINTNF